MEEFVQDLRYGVRHMVRRPGFALVLVLTLALGVGANTAVFSVVHGVLLRPLPYPDSDELAVAWTQFPTMELNEFPASWPEYSEYRDQNRSFEELGAWIRSQRTITGGDNAERLDIAFFSAEMWRVLDVAPALGRYFTQEEDESDAPVVVLSHGLWEGRFGAEPGVVGTTVELDGTTTTVIGVMPPGFAFPDVDTEAWLPMGIDPANPPGRANHFASMVGRLRDGTTLGQAETELQAILARWGEDESIGHTWGLPNHPAFLRDLHQQTVGDVRTALLVLLGAVGFVLLIACANVANLLLVRGEGRHREISIRTAMGAGRTRIVKQLVTESLVMALLGGIVGVGLAFVGLKVLLAMAPADLPRVESVGLNGPVLLFSIGVTVLSGFLFGLAPSLQAAHLNIQSSLREEGRGGTAGRGRFRLRQLLVVSEMAMAVVLLIAAGLLMQSFWRLQSVDPGFRSEDVLAFSINLPPGSYPEAPDVTGFYEVMMPRVAALPGVTAAGGVRTPPLTGSLPPNDIEIENRPPVDQEIPLNADVQVVLPGYFQTLGIPLSNGRTFNDGDHLEAEVVAVIDEVLAKRFFPDQDPLGQRIRQSGAAWARIVGVVGGVHQEGLDVEPRANLYLAHAQSPLTWYPIRGMTVLLRTGIEPLGLAAAVRQEIRALDANLPVYEVTTMEATVAQSTATERFSMFLQLIFAAVALSLAVIGIYGVLSYSVAQRTQEIGIRMALGAEQGSILKLVVGQGMGLVLVATVVGVLGALATAEVLSSLLFGISARDPLTYGVVTAVLITVAAVACYLPARRASTVSPQTALRAD